MKPQTVDNGGAAQENTSPNGNDGQGNSTGSNVTGGATNTPMSGNGDNRGASNPRDVNDGSGAVGSQSDHGSTSQAYTENDVRNFVIINMQ